MSQAHSAPKPELTCWDCGATNDPGASECWLCQRREWFSDGVRGPAKTGGSQGGDRAGRRVVGIVVVGAIAILGAAMALDLWNLAYRWIFLLALALLVPVLLIIRTRRRKRPVPGQPTTTGESLTAGEFLTAVTIIDAGAILLGWLVWVGGAAVLFFGLPLLLILASLTTWARARRRSIHGRPTTGLPRTASIFFLAALVPALAVASLWIAFFLICPASYQSAYR